MSLAIKFFRVMGAAQNHAIPREPDCGSKGCTPGSHDSEYPVLPKEKSAIWMGHKNIHHLMQVKRLVRQAFDFPVKHRKSAFLSCFDIEKFSHVLGVSALPS